MGYLPLYSKDQYRRHEVKPGITGLAQVHGRNSVRFSDKILYDLKYIESISLINDLKILYYTIQIVLTRQGINGNDLDPRERG
jgi:lipopolysaccharide/colanic/teichoic acid biosynthesis glycosyltransferase